LTAAPVLRIVCPMPLRPGEKPLPPVVQWFALGLAAVFPVTFFTNPVFAASLALSLGALATALDLARQDRRIPAALIFPGTCVFAFLLGVFADGFARHPQAHFTGRVLEGGGETILMIFSEGHLPFEGTEPLRPWVWVGASWVGLSLAAWAGVFLRRKAAHRSSQDHAG